MHFRTLATPRLRHTVSRNRLARLDKTSGGDHTTDTLGTLGVNLTCNTLTVHILSGLVNAICKKLNLPHNKQIGKPLLHTLTNCNSSPNTPRKQFNVTIGLLISNRPAPTHLVLDHTNKR